MPGSTVLSDVRIADMSTVLFGPYCTQTLGDMGAEVVKVEPPEGDSFRFVGRPARTHGMGPCHMTLNRGKRSVQWDLQSMQGRTALSRLIARSDVFIHNLRTEAMDRLGFSFEAVKSIRPDIVYVHCVGFGSRGPYSGRPAYDDVVQALSGTASLLSRVDGHPEQRFLPTALADKVSGLHAAYATLAALHHRNRTGEPVFVEVPMFEAVTHFMLEEHLYGQTFTPPNGPVCYQRQVDPTRQPIKTADGWICIAPYTDARWVRLFEAAGQADWLSQQGLTNATSRYRHVGRLMGQMAQIMTNRTTADLMDMLARADIPAAPVNDIGALAEDPHLQAVGFFQPRTHPTEGDYLELQPPVRFPGLPEVELRPAPLLGQHSEEIMRELGVEDESEAVSRPQADEASERSGAPRVKIRRVRSVRDGRL
ncbi:MAG: CoA transferase [Caulobacteraceae bacterium]|nr:CoA transferase [Caulobacteraceae bacterium]